VGKRQSPSATVGATDIITVIAGVKFSKFRKTAAFINEKNSCFL
jgi:hypothetical protein